MKVKDLKQYIKCLTARRIAIKLIQEQIDFITNQQSIHALNDPEQWSKLQDIHLALIQAKATLINSGR